MKKNVILSFIFLLAFAADIHSQDVRQGMRKTAVRKAVVNFTERAEYEQAHPLPLHELQNAEGKEDEEFEEREERVIANPMPMPSNAVINYDNTQQSNGPGGWNQVLSPPPSTNFNALDDNEQTSPPDANGAAGIDYLMVTLNSRYSVQTKYGSSWMTEDMSTFWDALGQYHVFDPRVLYDPYANRWINVAVANRGFHFSSVLVAVSETSNPLGNWFLYAIDATSDTTWADYPNVAFNKNWITVSCNMFGLGYDAVSPSNVYVFDKADLYAGGNGNYTMLTTPYFNIVPGTSYDSTSTTMYLVANQARNFVGNAYIRTSFQHSGIRSLEFT